LTPGVVEFRLVVVKGPEDVAALTSCSSRFKTVFRCHSCSGIISCGVCHFQAYPGLFNFAGKVGSLMAVTLNCRGLNNVNKLRLVLNGAYDLLVRHLNSIIMLQETMIVDGKYLDFAWRGLYAFTLGTGNFAGKTRGQCYKTSYGRKLRVFEISWSVCSWQAFPA
jgi:hypothetical protein